MNGRNLIKIVSSFILIGWIAQSCDVAYQYDIESGTDEYTGDESNVSIDTTMAIDASMYDKARIFPGLIDTAVERRIADTTISLDLSKVYLSPLELGV